MSQHIRDSKLSAPDMVYISGEEMTRVVMQQILDKWVSPYIDTSKWQTFDLSCRSREDTNDQVLKDAIAAGAKVGSIFKEPTVTPEKDQLAAFGLKKEQGSPNGAMRKGWGGFAMDRDTIHIPGMEEKLGYKSQVMYCRYPVGGEYGATHVESVGPGTIKMIHVGANGETKELGSQTLTDKESSVVMHNTPLDNVAKTAQHFFQRTLDAKVKPFVVTKKTVFKSQERFWAIIKKVYDEQFKDKFEAAGIMRKDEKLQHILSDAATMKAVRWKDGKFGMISTNYDGDMITDEISELHKSPAFITSVLNGTRADGARILEFEASHGTIEDQYRDHKAGKRTSVNPLGLVHALRGAIDHAADLSISANAEAAQDAAKIKKFTGLMYEAMTEELAQGKGTRDIVSKADADAGNFLSTEEFIDAVGARLQEKVRVNFGQLGRGSLSPAG